MGITMLIFHKSDGNKGYLTKEDLRVLMEKEFPGFLENQRPFGHRQNNEVTWTSAKMAE